MTPILAKVTAIEKRGDRYQVIVQISPKYRGSFNTLAFGEIKPHSGSLKDGRLDLVYRQNPGFNIGDPFPAWHPGAGEGGRSTAARSGARRERRSEAVISFVFGTYLDGLSPACDLAPGSLLSGCISTASSRNTISI
jgi:hypothetical protein